MRRASALAATAIALALVPTGTAHADAPGPTDYRSEITSISSADGQTLPEVFEVLALAVLVLALARPQQVDREVLSGEADAAQPAVLFLAAMLQQSQGATLAAERLLEKVVYLEPNHEGALLALALAAGRRGDTAAERRYRRRAAAAAEPAP